MGENTAVTIADLVSVDVDALTPTDRLAFQQTLQQAINLLQGKHHDTTMVMDARGDTQAITSLSTRAWLRHTLRISDGEAKNRVHTARALRELPMTTKLFSEGH